MTGLKSSLQGNKYVRFLLLSTLISCSLFILNITLGFDRPETSFKYNSSIVTEEVVTGDIRPEAGSSSGSSGLKEHTPKFQITQFWETFAELLVKYSPPLDFKLDHKRPESCKLETNLIDPVYDGELYSEEFLGKCLTLNYDKYKMLMDLHSKFVKALPLDYGKGSEYYQKDGIVMIGGGKYSVMTMLVIQILRERGTQLPVEVMIPHGEVDEDFCRALPKWNAKCIQPIIEERVWKGLHLTQYQIKIVSLISSSFENLLYLDSDNYPLVKLDNIFQNELYLETGFVSWPDFWRRSTSPAFYKIAGLEVGKQVRNNIDEFSPVEKYAKGTENLLTEVAYHDRQNTIPDGSSETSSIMINKLKHAQTLMLSFYYNYNGPTLYYQLLTQGNFGEGDKETFVAAAHVLHAPYYQLKTKPMVGGELLHGGKTPRGTSMIQFDPTKDYELYLKLKLKFGAELEQGEDIQEYDLSKVAHFFNDDNKNAMFLHYNLGKMDPLKLHNFNQRRFGYDLKMIGFDFEYRNIELMNSFICDDKLNTRINFQYLKSSNHDEICNYLLNIIKMMSETSDRVVVN